MSTNRDPSSVKWDRVVADPLMNCRFVPAVVKTLSGVTGGALAVNTLAGTAFLFPACFLWGLLRERVAIRHARTWRRTPDVLYPRA